MPQKKFEFYQVFVRKSLNTPKLHTSDELNTLFSNN